jgi:hypothetical protein
MVMPDRIFFSGRPPNSVSQGIGGAKKENRFEEFGIGNA